MHRAGGITVFSDDASDAPSPLFLKPPITDPPLHLRRCDGAGKERRGEGGVGLCIP